MSNIHQLTINKATAIEGMHDRIQDVKSALEQRINLGEYSENIQTVTLNFSVVLRICLLAGLSDKSPRSVDDVNKYNLASSHTPYATTFFTKANIGHLFAVLIKMRYHEVEANWQDRSWISKVIGREILRGREILLKEGGIESWLRFVPLRGGKTENDIPVLICQLGSSKTECQPPLTSIVVLLPTPRFLSQVQQDLARATCWLFSCMKYVHLLLTPIIQSTSFCLIIKVSFLQLRTNLGYSCLIRIVLPF